MTDLTRAALSQPEPAGLSAEELLQIAAKTIEPYEDCGIGIDEYEAETECAVEAYGSELIAFARTAIAADRAQRQPLPTHDLSNVAPLLWVLWNHLGARSPVGQPIREYLGMGQFQPMTDAQMAAANQYRALLWNSPQPEPEGLSDEELLRVYGLAKRDHCYEGPLDDWPTRAERAATVAGLRAAIAADRAQRQPVPVSEWRTIDTAPKDGTEILASDYDAVEILSWRKGRFELGIPGEWISRDGQAFFPAWWQPLADHPALPLPGEVEG